MIPYGRQHITREDVQAVIDALESDFLTQGPMVPEFERRLREYCKSTHAVAVSSASAALHLACRALEVGPGDCVWTSPITFVATSNAVLHCGAHIDFVDIDPATYNMCPKALSRKIENSAQSGSLPKAVIPVHLAGQPCDMAAIREVTDRYGVKVIEDASHSIGAHYRGYPVGACAYSDITVFSFHPVKIITTGEGGAALTNDAALAERMAMDRTHGVTRDASIMEYQPHGPWYYEQQRLGFNYRMTDIAAALGCSQIDRLDTYISRRRKIAAIYCDNFKGLAVTTPKQISDSQSSWHLYVLRVPKRHLELFEKLRASGVGVNLHYMPVYKQPYYQRLGFPYEYCSAAEAYYAEAISLPIYPTLSDEDQRKVIEIVTDAVRP